MYLSCIPIDIAQSTPRTIFFLCNSNALIPLAEISPQYFTNNAKFFMGALRQLRERFVRHVVGPCDARLAKRPSQAYYYVGWKKRCIK